MKAEARAPATTSPKIASGILNAARYASRSGVSPKCAPMTDSRSQPSTRLATRVTIMIAEARAIDIGNTLILRHRVSFASMPAKKRKRSALKRIRQTQRRTSMRTIGRSAARTAVRTAREVIAKGGATASEVIAAAASALDKAAKRGSIHKNSARRRKSRIAKAATKAKKKT